MSATLAEVLPGYSKRKLALIEMGLCVRCGEREGGGYRMCLPCRSELAEINAGLRPKPKKKSKPKKKVKKGKRGRPKIVRGYWPEIHGKV